MSPFLHIIETKLEVFKLAIVSGSSFVLTAFMGWASEQLLVLFAFSLATEMKEWIPIIIGAVSGVLWMFFTSLYRYEKYRTVKMENDRREKEIEMMGYLPKKQMVEEIKEKQSKVDLQ